MKITFVSTAAATVPTVALRTQGETHTRASWYNNSSYGSSRCCCCCWHTSLEPRCAQVSEPQGNSSKDRARNGAYVVREGYLLLLLSGAFSRANLNQKRAFLHTTMHRHRMHKISRRHLDESAYQARQQVARGEERRANAGRTRAQHSKAPIPQLSTSATYCCAGAAVASKKGGVCDDATLPLYLISPPYLSLDKRRSTAVGAGNILPVSVWYVMLMRLPPLSSLCTSLRVLLFWCVAFQETLVWVRCLGFLFDSFCFLLPLRDRGSDCV